MEIRKLLGMAVLGLAMATAGACGDDTGATNDGGSPPTDSSTGNDGGGPPPDDGAKLVGDWRCVGERTFPTGEGVDDQEITFVLREFNANDGKDGPPLAGICVEIFTDNQVQRRNLDPQPCNATLGGITDAQGRLTFQGKPGTYIAYYAYGGQGTRVGLGTTDTYIPYAGQYYEIPDDGEPVEGVIINTTLRDNIPNAIFGRAAPGKAALTGEILDCAKDPVAKMTMRVVKNGQVVPATAFVRDDSLAEELKIAYFFAGTPDRRRTDSNKDGLFLALNVPIEGEGDTALLASCDPDGNLVGCVEAALIPGGVNSIPILPIFADGASCPANACQ